MAAKKKGAGGSLTRSQVVTVRLDPKLKFAAELAARKQRRTISSFIEWAVEKAVSEEMVNGVGTTALEAMTNVWDVDDADRFIKFAIAHPELLNFEEERLWKLIRDTPYFFKHVERAPDNRITWMIEKYNIWFPRVRDHWELLNMIVQGEESQDALPNKPDDEIVDEQIQNSGNDVPF